MKSLNALKTSGNRLALAVFIVTLLITSLICQPLFILLRDQLLAFQLSSLQLATGIPTPDDVILYPASTSFFENLKTTWVLLTLPAECQIWLAQMSGAEIFYSEIESTPLKKDLWQRAITLYCSALILSTASALWVRQGYLARVSNPISDINRYIASLAENPRQLIAPLDMKDAPQELVQTAANLSGLATDIRLALRQKDRLADIGIAVAKINHDLRNILGAATLVSDALDMSEDPRIRSASPIINRSLEDASQFCQHMLDYLTLQPEPKPICVKLAPLTEELKASSDIKIIWAGADRLFVDPVMFKRLLLNLSRNAARAGATQIMLDVWRAGHLAVIDVSDNGPGIGADMQPHLFSAFFSGHRGSGLGLSIAKDLALAMGGDIKLSRTGDSGSEFRLQLPADILPKNQRPGQAQTKAA